jgi:60 kDa SS-A/Ro ribonucleoprotein
MAAPITGTRTGPSTAVRCVDVAALVTAALARRNRSAVVLPFDDSVIETPVDIHTDVARLATTLASFGGGGTSCSAPLAWLNTRAQGAELVVFVSDNQSWLDARSGPKTALVREWRRF